uniref:ARAD1B03366p n=1 Tax=Blastobotrys adeninivorans TaxID=409370 RepID=A0A060T4G8_BLAAD
MLLLRSSLRSQGARGHWAQGPSRGSMGRCVGPLGSLRMISSGVSRRATMQAAVPPPPSSLPKSKPPSKWGRRLVYLAGGLVTIYAYDRVFNASALVRASRCIVDLMIVGLDYKFNFVEGKDIAQLHERSSERMYNLLISNKGLYIKLGQAIAIQQGVFPKVYQEKFSRLFDRAPQDSWAQVEQVITKELGTPPDELFDFIDHRAIASASIAQVHRARLKTGEWVAVKVQHADIAKQVWWDLAAYKWIMYVYDRFLFKLPIYFVAEHVAERLEREVNFEFEAANSERLRNHLLTDGHFSPDLYVPKLYPDLTTKRVMVTEWIQGTTLSDDKTIARQHFNISSALNKLMKLYGRQVYEWGLVHCDPHPGNLIARRVNGRDQLVLVDHGLYIYEDDKFRQQYSRLWAAMFSGNVSSVVELAKEWGFGDTDLFASSIVLQPYGSLKKDTDHHHDSHPTKEKNHEVNMHEEFQEQKDMRDRFQSFLKDTTKIPLELIFLGRAMRILQGLNKRFGSPVNRIKVFASEATRAVRRSEPLTIRNVLYRIKDYFVFLTLSTVSDFAFYAIRFKQVLFGSNTAGMEDLLDERMRDAAKEMGMDLPDLDEETRD